MDEQQVRDESLSALLRQLQVDFAHLVDTEKALAKKELSIKASELKRDGMKLGTAAVLMLFGAFCVTWAIVLLLALAIPLWLSSLLVGAALAGAGALLAVKFRSDMKRFDAVPQRALGSVQRDVHAVKEAMQ